MSIVRDLAVFSHRYPVKTQIELLLGSRLDDGSDWVWPLADAFVGGAETPRLIVVDVLKLLSSEVAHLPRLTRASPNVLVVGLPEDSTHLVAAWHEGIPAYPLEALKPEILMQMLARSEDGCEFYDFLGRHGAERVHSFLARRLERRVLTEREIDIVRLLRLGWKNAHIASYLGLEIQTVKNHVLHINQKPGVSSRYELLARAAEPISEMSHPLRAPVARTKH